MMLFRNARLADLDAIHHLAAQSGIGLTTLPKDKSLLRKRLQQAHDSCKKEVSKPLNEYYLFVLEDPDNNNIIGISAIDANVGHDTPFYSYKLSKHTRICPSLQIGNTYKLLRLVNDFHGCSEMCTLFLHPQFRKGQNGLLLSKARFLFMAHHSQRFSHRVIADIRGVSNEQNQSPFWDSVGAHFFPFSYMEADRLTLATNKQFIADLMPRNPIYLPLLSAEAQAVLGQPHPASAAAMNILLKEGFHYNNYVDIFDAGPTLEASIQKIKTISSSYLIKISSFSDEISSGNYLLSNAQLDFRATLNHIVINSAKNTCVINKDTAMLLKVKCGNHLRIAQL